VVQLATSAQQFGELSCALLLLDCFAGLAAVAGPASLHVCGASLEGLLAGLASALRHRSHIGDLRGSPAFG
ncbi:hypothetical protein AAIH16_37005, partial [Pseudomonas aeruginosa]